MAAACHMSLRGAAAKSGVPSTHGTPHWVKICLTSCTTLSKPSSRPHNLASEPRMKITLLPIMSNAKRRTSWNHSAPGQPAYFQELLTTSLNCQLTQTRASGSDSKALRMAGLMLVMVPPDRELTVVLLSHGLPMHLARFWENPVAV